MKDFSLIMQAPNIIILGTIKIHVPDGIGQDLKRY